MMFSVTQATRKKKKYKFRQQGIIAGTDALPLNYTKFEAAKDIKLGS